MLSMFGFNFMFRMISHYLECTFVIIQNLFSNIKYNYITHLEESSTEWKYLLHKMRVDSVTYIPERYEWSPTKKDEVLWSTIPRRTAEKIYQHYFTDFVLFGNS